MREVELILGLVAAVAGLAALARRFNVPYPIFMVVAGMAIGWIPGIPRFELEPEIVFLLFLPPLLFVAASSTSIRDVRANTRPIGLLAVGLVVFTIGVVAAVAHWVIPGLSWPMAFALGAIVAPPDAIAATAVLQRVGAPKRLVTILEGESLLNDATALVAYRLALVAAVSATRCRRDTRTRRRTPTPMMRVRSGCTSRRSSITGRSGACSSRPSARRSSTCTPGRRSATMSVAGSSVTWISRSFGQRPEVAQSGASSYPAHVPTENRTGRVLVVDDDRGIREFVCTVLADEGYEVTEAMDGRQALEHADRVRPDVILLDMRMPVMDGWEFARTYRQRPGPHAPIVIVTAALDVAKDAQDIGADGFLAKPFQLDDLLDLVERHAAPSA